MPEMFTDFPFAYLGWALLQFLWISTLTIAGVALVLKLLDRFSSRLKYLIALSALLSMTIVPGLLWVEHNGTLPPIGLADWGSGAEVANHPVEPILEGLPKVWAMNLGQDTQFFYYWLGVTWIIGAAFYLSHLLISALILNLECRKLGTLEDTRINQRLNKLKRKLNISRKYRLRKVSLHQGPAVTGIIRPFLLIPSSLSEEYNDKELNALLLHELMHIKRKDYLFSLLQRVIGSLFFAQPLIGWLNRRIDQEREQACDEAVTGITNDTHTYASTLIKLYQQTQPAFGRVLNITGNSILERIKKLAEKDFHTMSQFQKKGRYLIAGLIVAITLFSTLWNSYHLHYKEIDQENKVELVPN